MARLFVFAIGGTGSRVLKSLTMLLAAGVQPEGNKKYEIVPIIIDPHRDNKDLLRTKTLLRNYQSIVDEVGIDNGFFGTKLSTLDRLVPDRDRLEGSFTYNMQEISQKTFRDYIDYNTLHEANRALIDLMFSGKSIDSRGNEIDLIDIEMNIGFVGNPNVGSVVLNQFKDSPEFKEFANNYNADDRIFIISSIFGGTGAAGFPAVLKNIRNAMNIDEINSKQFLQDARIGALSVMPYFNVEKKEDSPIQKSDWIAKTKSALHYYKDNITGEKPLVNAMYYIADDYSGVPYENDPGNEGQQNKAHFVEVASALSIIDFLGIPDGQLNTMDGVALEPVFHEYGIKSDTTDLSFLDLGNKTQKLINRKLTQLFFFKKYLDEHFSDALNKQSYSTDDKPGSPPISNSFMSNEFYRSYFTEFINAFHDWLRELAINKRGFSPFNMNADLKNSIKGIDQKKGIFLSDIDYVLFDKELSKASGDLGYINANHKFISIFNKATSQILNDKFDYFKNLK